ncbi:hypothetical protein LRC484719_46820 [Mycobacterium riyadhense]
MSSDRKGRSAVWDARCGSGGGAEHIVSNLGGFGALFRLAARGTQVWHNTRGMGVL